MNRSTFCRILHQRMQRRTVLKGIGSVTLLALLSACNHLLHSPDPVAEDGSAPTAKAHQTPLPPELELPPTSQYPPLPVLHSKAFLPLIVSSSENQVAKTSTPTAATPTETRPSPSVSPSPTLTPTPFPPGPPSKLGLFVTHHHPQILELMRTGNVAVIKTMSQDADFLTELKSISPQTLFIGRLPVDQIDLAKVQPSESARRLVDQLLPIATNPRLREVFDAWEGHNEPVTVDAEQMKRLAELEAERVRLLAREGIRSVVGNFGTGNPPLELWPHFYPALEAIREYAGFLGLHEYSAPTMQFGTHGDGEGWLTLRYRKAYRQYLIPAGLAVPLVITECGIDGMVQNRPGPKGKGWKDFITYWAEQGMGMDGPGNYIEQLAWYDSELMKDDYVVGAAIFTMTTTRQWQSYEILGEAAAILHQYLSVHPAR